MLTTPILEMRQLRLRRMNNHTAGLSLSPKPRFLPLAQIRTRDSQPSAPSTTPCCSNKAGFPP